MNTTRALRNVWLPSIHNRRGCAGILERHLKHSPRRSRHADRGRVISLPREKRLLDILESEFDSGSTSNLFDNPGFDIMIATISWRQMHKTIIFCLNPARQLQTNNEQTRTQNRPTCWQLASEVDPHGPSCAVPSGLRFWLAVDHRTNDSSSVCAICEAYYISTRCESLYPKCNRISSNKSMNLTPYSPIPRRQRHFVDCQRTRMIQLTKDFAMRHDENYVEWNGISIKWYQFVTNCPYHQTIFQE